MKGSEVPRRASVEPSRPLESCVHGQFGEARAQVESQSADNIRDSLANPTSDKELLLKLAEARSRLLQIDENVKQQALENVKQQAWREMLLKFELDRPVRPPKHARFAVFLLPRWYQQIIFGDLEEQYPLWVEECGQVRATFLYWWQFILSTVILSWPRLRRWRYITVALCLTVEILKHLH